MVSARGPGPLAPTLCGVQIPASLAWWGASEAGAAWLARLPRLAQECATAWDLEAGEAYASLVLRVRRADGRPPC